MALVIPKSVGGDYESPENKKTSAIEKKPVNLVIPATVGGDFVAPTAQVKAMPSPQEDASAWQSVKDFFTGNDRATPETDSLPELGSEIGLSDFAGNNQAEALKAAIPILTTLDPEGIVNIVKSVSPDIKVLYNKDAQGNVFPIIANNKTGAVAQINRPGMSALDVLQGLGLMAAFTPAGRSGVGATTATRGALKVGATSAATQGGLNAIQQAAGRDASAEQIAEEVAFAGAGGAAFEILGRAVASLGRTVLNKVRGGRIDDATREAIIQQATKLGIPADEITDDYIRQAAKLADDAYSPNAAATALENEFDIPLTNAERSGNQAALSAEDSIRAGLRGSRAQDIFLSQEANRTQQITNAAGKLQDEIAGGANTISARQEAGASLREGVKAAQKTANAARREAYDAVGDAAIDSDGLKGILKSVRRSVRRIDFDPTLPETSKVLDNLKGMDRLLSGMKGSIKPFQIKKVELFRKRLNRHISAATKGEADWQQLIEMKGAFDDAMDEAVANGLFKGSADSLEQLKTARQINADYAKLFKSKDSPIIKRIIEKNPTDEEVINSLFNASGFNKSGAANLAKTYKTILKDNPEAWGMVRQAALKNLIKTNSVNGKDVISGQKTLTAINKAYEQNASLMKELFTPQEMAKIRRFVTLVKKTQPDIVKSRENPSGTSQKLLKEGANILKTITPFFDNGAISVTSTGAVFFKNRAAAKEAAKAFRPFENIMRTQAETAIESGLIGGVSGEAANRL